jgi:alpha-galactosidase
MRWAALTAAAAAGGLAAAAPNGLGRTPMMSFNTWCAGSQCAYDICDEWTTREMALAIKSSGLYDAGWTVYSFDDCWASTTRDANGELFADVDRFPSGMAAMVAWLKAQGFGVSLYTSLGPLTCKHK